MNGESSNLHNLEGKVALIVNTASKCGFTPQFDGLEKLHQRFSDRGLVVLGFPCNQFGSQDPGTNDDIQSFCKVNYGVTFQMHQKIDVNGPDAHPLYEHLKDAAPGVLGSKAIKWNFTKFLVDQKGKVLKRYASRVAPKKIAADIEELLN